MYYILNFSSGKLNKDKSYWIVDTDDLSIELISYADLVTIFHKLRDSFNLAKFPCLVTFEDDNELWYYSNVCDTGFWEYYPVTDDVNIGRTWAKISKYNTNIDVLVCNKQIDINESETIYVNFDIGIIEVHTHSEVIWGISSVYRKGGTLIMAISISKVSAFYVFIKNGEYQGVVLIKSGDTRFFDFDTKTLAKFKLLGVSNVCIPIKDWSVEK